MRREKTSRGNAPNPLPSRPLSHSRPPPPRVPPRPPERAAQAAPARSPPRHGSPAPLQPAHRSRVYRLAQRRGHNNDLCPLPQRRPNRRCESDRPGARPVTIDPVAQLPPSIPAWFSPGLGCLGTGRRTRPASHSRRSDRRPPVELSCETRSFIGATPVWGLTRHAPVGEEHTLEQQHDEIGGSDASRRRRKNDQGPGR